MSTHAIPSGLSLEIRRTFDAPPEAVYAAWTRKDQLERWMCRDVPSQNPRYVEFDPRPGGRYTIEIDTPDGALYRGSGLFHELQPPKKVVFTWAWIRIPEKTGEELQTNDSLITVQLFPRGSGTEMLFVQEHLQSEHARNDHASGWDGCFIKLAEIL